LAGIVLAAGASQRMGREKALLPWRGRTFLTAAIDALQSATEVVTVIAGKNADVLRPMVYAAGAYLIENPHPERGQFSSLQLALQDVLNRGRDAAMVMLVDRPPVEAGTLRQLRSAFDSALLECKWAVVPEYQGRHGHPMIVAREMITVFLRAAPTAVAGQLMKENQQFIAYVSVEDPLAIANIDTPQQLEQLETDPVPGV
jgi:molybdenum cofactor cytidylyltransferase